MSAETPRDRAIEIVKTAAGSIFWLEEVTAAVDALLASPDILRELAASVAPVDTTPDLGNREELVDVLDTHMRLDGRADAERVADALIARPALLRALSSRAAFTSPGDRVRAPDGD